MEIAVWHHLALSDVLVSSASRCRVFEITIIHLWSVVFANYSMSWSLVALPTEPRKKSFRIVNPSREIPRINALTMRRGEEMFPE
jgi:hypothetical protein